MAPERDIDLEKYSTSSTSLPSYRSTSPANQSPGTPAPDAACKWCCAVRSNSFTIGASIGVLSIVLTLGLLGIQDVFSNHIIPNAEAYCRDKPWVVGIYNNNITLLFGLVFMVAATTPAAFFETKPGLVVTMYGSMLLWTVFAVFLAPYFQHNPLICEGEATILYANGTTCLKGLCEAYDPSSR